MRAVTNWIDVNERLPEESGHVLVFANDIISSWVDVVNAYFCPEYEYVTWEETKTNEDYAPIVTHWMPLPSPPETGVQE